MSIPTAAACRNLICGTASQLTPRRSRGAEVVDPGLLLTQPDPSTTWASQMQWTVDDLLHYGAAYWLVIARDGIATERNPRGLPVRARRLDPREVEVVLTNRLTDYQRVSHYMVNGTRVEPENVIRFDAGHEGVLKFGARTLQQSVELEMAAQRMASIDLPAGVLTNLGTELSPEEASELVAQFAAARQKNSIAFLQGVEFTTSQIDAHGMQLVEARGISATEVARLYNVPVSLVSASPTGNSSALLYANVSQNFAAFVKQSVAPLVLAIEQALSDDAVTPHGNRVTLDTQAYLRSDPQASVDFAATLVQTEIISPDEARSFLGLPPSGSPTSDDLTPGAV